MMLRAWTIAVVTATLMVAATAVADPDMGYFYTASDLFVIQLELRGNNSITDYPDFNMLLLPQSDPNGGTVFQLEARKTPMKFTVRQTVNKLRKPGLLTEVFHTNDVRVNAPATFSITCRNDDAEAAFKAYAAVYNDTMTVTEKDGKLTVTTNGSSDDIVVVNMLVLFYDVGYESSNADGNVCSAFFEADATNAAGWFAAELTKDGIADWFDLQSAVATEVQIAESRVVEVQRKVKTVQAKQHNVVVFRLKNGTAELGENLRSTGIVTSVDNLDKGKRYYTAEGGPMYVPNWVVDTMQPKEVGSHFVERVSNISTLTAGELLFPYGPGPKSYIIYMPVEFIGGTDLIWFAVYYNAIPGLTNGVIQAKTKLPPPFPDGSWSIGQVVGASVGGVVALCVAVGGCYFYRKKTASPPLCNDEGQAHTMLAATPS